MGVFRYILDHSDHVFIVFCIALLILLRQYLRRENFYTLIISSLLSFALVEGICRLENIGSPEVAVWREERVKGNNSPYIYKPNGKLRYHYPDNPRGYFDEKNEVLGTINAKGFRGLDRSFEKESRKIRLAFLGDSFTLGLGVRDEDTLPADVEHELQKNYGNVEVLNFGVTDSDTSDQIKLLEKYVLEFKPDIVVIVLFLNDANRTATIEFLSRPWVFTKIRKHSYFINAFVGSIEKIIMSKKMIRHYREGFLEDSPGYQSIKSALRKGKLLSSEHQFYFVVALYPLPFQLNERYPFRFIHQMIEDFCAAENIPFVDLFNAFLGKRDKEMWVHPTDQHPNEVAHRLAARELTDYLKKERFIDKVLEKY